MVTECAGGAIVKGAKDANKIPGMAEAGGVGDLRDGERGIAQQGGGDAAALAIDMVYQTFAGGGGESVGQVIGGAIEFGGKRGNRKGGIGQADLYQVDALLDARAEVRWLVWRSGGDGDDGGEASANQADDG